MTQIIIGNIIALIGSLLMVYSGTIKQKKKILIVQTIQIGLYIISNLILGGITDAIINALSFVRNVLYYKDKLGKKEKLIIIGLLPLISTVVYIWLMSIKDVIKFKKLIIFTMILWFIYDIVIKSYSSAVFDFMNIIANVISIIQLKK